jgi:hypothetical protein
MRSWINTYCLHFLFSWRFLRFRETGSYFQSAIHAANGHAYKTYKKNIDMWCDICIFVCIFVHICVYSLHMCYTRFGAYPNRMHITILVIVKKTCWKKRKVKTREKKQKRKSQQHRLETNVRIRAFNVGLLARSQFASGRSCDRPTRSRFSVVGPRAYAEVVPKFHVALHASHAALPMGTLKISPYTNVTLTLGWITLFMGDMGEGFLHREDEVTVK